MTLRGLVSAALLIFLPSVASASPVTITFDFEDLAATALPRSGALSILSLSKSGLKADITRPSGRFDVIANVGSQTKPSAYGLRSLDPFVQESAATPFVVNFTTPVRSVAVDMGDYGQDSPDTLTVRAYSGPNATGTLIGTATGSLPTLQGNPFNSRRLQVTSNSDIKSLQMIGGTPSFPNSVFYDNLTVTAHPIASIPSNTFNTVVRSGEFEWNSRYRLEFSSEQLRVTVRIRLRGDDPGADLRALWEAGIERIWSNRFDVVDGPFRYPMLFDVQFVTFFADHVVSVHSGDGRSDMLNWFTESNWGPVYLDEIAAHEFGHMLGLFDEYAGGAVNPDISPNTFTNALMADLGAVQERYYDQILRNLGNMSGRDLSLGQSPLPPPVTDPPTELFAQHHAGPPRVPNAPSMYLLLLAAVMLVVRARGRNTRLRQ